VNSGKTIFAQLLDFLPLYDFRQCVARYRGNFKVKSFSCWDQFLAMAFAQLTFRESLRDIEACLHCFSHKLYHCGFRSQVFRNTLANANSTRDWRIFSDFASVLIAQARQLYIEDNFGVDLQQTVYALDSTTIDLCLSLFPWAQFRRRKSAVKLHTLLDLRGNIPTIIIVTSGRIHDVKILDQLCWEAAAIYVMDRGYLDFERLYHIDQSRAFFVTRPRTRFDFKRIYSLPVEKSTGVICDQIIKLGGVKVKRDYPQHLRRIRYKDEEANLRLVFITNNFTLPAETIAALYRQRWQVELFFKWIKQHLRIKAFFGTTENAVKTQIWIAISIYVLVAIVKKELKLEISLHTMLQILSVSLFEKMPLLEAFSDKNFKEQDSDFRKSLISFE
jgi:hypothetical protein